MGDATVARQAREITALQAQIDDMAAFAREVNSVLFSIGGFLNDYPEELSPLTYRRLQRIASALEVVPEELLNE